MTPQERESTGAKTAFTDFTSGRIKAAEHATSLDDVGRNIGAAWAGTQAYLAVQSKRLQAIVRNIILYAVLGVVLAIVAIAMVVCATATFISGIAEGIGSALGGRQWAGNLITGGVIILTILVGGYIVITRMIGSARKLTVASYQKSAPASNVKSPVNPAAN